MSRQDKALLLYESGAVKRIHDDCYYVKSQNPKSREEYEVIPSMNVCSCTDFERTGQPCKHVMSVQIYRTSQIAAVVTAAKTAGVITA